MKMKDINIEIFIPGELKNEPIIYDMIKKFDINMKIVEASFSTESGWAYLILNGKKLEINKVFAFLQKKGVNIEIKQK